MKLKFKKSKDGKAFFLTLWRNGVHDYVNPVRDWMIGLCVATTVFLFGVGYIAFDFYTQFGASDDAVQVESQSIGYRDVEVKRYAEQYTERERVFNELRTETAYVMNGVATSVAPKEEEAPSNEPGLADIELAQ